MKKGRKPKGLVQLNIHIDKNTRDIINTRAQFERCTLGEYIKKHLVM